jgi:elongation factor Ts
MEGRLGVLIELGANDVTATGRKTIEALAHDLTLHIAANSPRYLSLQDIPVDLVREEREILMAQLAKENKPEHIKAKIVQGRLDKLAQEICLLKQAFAKDESISIQELLEQKSKDIGASITINRFAHFKVGD